MSFTRIRGWRGIVSEWLEETGESMLEVPRFAPLPPGVDEDEPD